MKHNGYHTVPSVAAYRASRAGRVCTSVLVITLWCLLAAFVFALVFGVAGYLRRHFADDPAVDQIDRQQAALWRAALSAGTLSKGNERHAGAPCDQTVCKYVRAARKIFAEALDQDLIAINPFDRLRGTPARRLRDWAYLTQADMQQIYEACPDAGWRAFFALLRYAGLRRGEALRLRWADVNFEKNRICVNAPGTITAEDTKHYTRFVPIEAARCPSGLAGILHETFDLAEAGTVRVCDRVCSDNPKSFTTVNTRAAKIIVSAGIAKYAKIHHTLRRNAEQDWAAQYPQHVTSEWAGHSIEVSAQFYLRVPEELYARPAPAGIVR